MRSRCWTAVRNLLARCLAAVAEAIRPRPNAYLTGQADPGALRLDVLDALRAAEKTAEAAGYETLAEAVGTLSLLWALGADNVAAEVLEIVAAPILAGLAATAEGDEPGRRARSGALPLLVALAVLLPALGPAPAAAEEDAYYDVALTELAGSSPGAHIHSHVCLVGTVAARPRTEADGDVHVELCEGRSCAVLEAIPELPLAKRPRKGSRIRACGIVRYDGWHRWWELHPLLSWAPAS